MKHLKCLSEVQNKIITQRESKPAYGILRRTINYKIKNLHNLKIGHPMIFSSKKEKRIVDHLIIMSNYEFPIDKSGLKHIVKSFLDKIGKKVRIP